MLEREREGGTVCVCVCVCVWERERERHRERERDGRGMFAWIYFVYTWLLPKKASSYKAVLPIDSQNPVLCNWPETNCTNLHTAFHQSGARNQCDTRTCSRLEYCHRCGHSHGLVASTHQTLQPDNAMYSDEINEYWPNDWVLCRMLNKKHTRKNNS